MSRLAKRPVILTEGVTISQDKNTLTVKGQRTGLSSHFPSDRVKITQTGQEVMVEPAGPETIHKAAAGLVRNVLANLVKGVKEDFVKELTFSGVGYRAAAEGRKLTLNVGFSHPVVLEAPEGISVSVKKSTITVSGADNHAVGQFAANIRNVRPPEPYKGKGIAYAGEHIRRKAGKAGKAGA